MLWKSLLGGSSRSGHQAHAGSVPAGPVASQRTATSSISISKPVRESNELTSSWTSVVAAGFEAGGSCVNHRNHAPRLPGALKAYAASPARLTGGASVTGADRQAHSRSQRSPLWLAGIFFMKMPGLLSEGGNDVACYLRAQAAGERRAPGQARRQAHGLLALRLDWAEFQRRTGTTHRDFFLPTFSSPVLSSAECWRLDWSAGCA